MVTIKLLYFPKNVLAFGGGLQWFDEQRLIDKVISLDEADPDDELRVRCDISGLVQLYGVPRRFLDLLYDLSRYV